MALEGAPPRKVDSMLRDMAPGRLPVGRFTEATGAVLALSEHLLTQQPLLDSSELAQELAGLRRPEERCGAGLLAVLVSHLPLGRRGVDAGAPEGRRSVRRGVDAGAPEGRRSVRRGVDAGAPEARRGADGDGADSTPLVRAIPIALAGIGDRSACLSRAEDAARLTHTDPDCVAGTALLAAMLWQLVNGSGPRQALQQAVYARRDFPPGLVEIMRTAPTRRRDQLFADGQVASMLERVVHAFITTASFGEALTRVANLGGEASTAGTLLGALAGAAYRHRGIPAHWREKVHGIWPRRKGALWCEKELVALAEQLVQQASADRDPAPVHRFDPRQKVF